MHSWYFDLIIIFWIKYNSASASLYLIQNIITWPKYHSCIVLFTIKYLDHLTINNASLKIWPRQSAVARLSTVHRKRNLIVYHNCFYYYQSNVTCQFNYYSLKNPTMSLLHSPFLVLANLVSKSNVYDISLSFQI